MDKSIDHFNFVISASIQYGRPTYQKNITISRGDLQHALSDYGLYLRYSGNLAIDDNTVLFKHLQSYQGVSGCLPPSLISSFVDTYHTNLLDFFPLYLFAFGNMSFDDIRVKLEYAIQPYYDDFLELYLVLDGLLELSTNDSICEIDYLLGIKEWMKGDVILEMIMLRGIMNIIVPRYYFSYDTIKTYMDIAHPSFTKNIAQLGIRVHGVIQGMSHNRYSDEGKKILQNILRLMCKSCLEEQDKISLYEGDKDYFVAILTDFERSITSGLSSTM